eukprot:6172084-Pleurochrysis_carterae.AAC.3
MRDNRDVECCDHLAREVPRRVDDDVVAKTAREHREYALVEIHDREVGAAVAVHNGIIVNACRSDRIECSRQRSRG